MNVFHRLYRRKSLLSSLLSRVSLFTVQLFAISSVYLTRLLCSSALYWQHAFAHYCGLSSEGYFHWRPWHKWGQGEICSGIVNLSYLRFSFRFPLFAFINCIYHCFPSLHLPLPSNFLAFCSCFSCSSVFSVFLPLAKCSPVADVFPSSD